MLDFIIFVLKSIWFGIAGFFIGIFWAVVNAVGDFFGFAMFHIKNFRLEFTFPILRIVEVVISEILLSAAVSALIWFDIVSWMPETLLIIITRFLFVPYFIIQIIFNIPYLRITEANDFISTNLLAYGVLTFCACVTAGAANFFDAGTIVYTWAFMPFKMFYFAEITGKVLSAFLVGLILCIGAVIVRIVYWAFTYRKNTVEIDIKDIESIEESDNV